LVTFTGKGFVTDISLYTIMIDERVCRVVEASITQVKCVTSPRPGLYKEPRLEIRIEGVGSVAT